MKKTELAPPKYNSGRPAPSEYKSWLRHCVGRRRTTAHQRMNAHTVTAGTSTDTARWRAVRTPGTDSPAGRVRADVRSVAVRNYT